MSARPTIRRRQLLLGAIGLGLPLLWRSLGPGPWMTRAHGSDSARLVRLLRHQRSARVVGREYLRVVPEEARRDVLTSLVVDRFPAGYRTLGTATDGQLHEFLLLATRQDFLQGRTVELHGWVVSLTEARWCAITTL